MALSRLRKSLLNIPQGRISIVGVALVLAHVFNPWFDFKLVQHM